MFLIELMSKILKISVAIIVFTLGFLLTSVNIYGEFKDIRPAVFFNEELRFTDDQPVILEQTLSQLVRSKNESDLQFSQRITPVIAAGLAHIHWERYAPEKFNQLIPIWENYFLYFMGKFSNIPEFEKYHFADYERSLERGIGICGDASMILSQVLSDNNIENDIVTFPGHVIVSAVFNNKKEQLFDADFGVSLPFSLNEIKQSPSLVNDYYLDAGYFDYDIKAFNRIYNNNYQRWNGVKHFITNKYYFEKVSYFLKWPMPIFLLLISIFYFIKHFRIANT
jgi:hypothetical protein